MYRQTTLFDNIKTKWDVANWFISQVKVVDDLGNTDWNDYVKKLNDGSWVNYLDKI